MPPRPWAFPVVGLPGCGLSRSWAPPGFGPSQLWASAFVVHPICGPPRFRVLRRRPSRLLLRRHILEASIWVSFFVDPRCVFSTARCALPAPFFGGRPVCSGRANGCCALRWLSCQIFFERMPVSCPRRCPIRRQFLDGRPFSWIYARLSWAGGWQVPAVPAKLAVFLLGGG